MGSGEWIVGSIAFKHTFQKAEHLTGGCAARVENLQQKYTAHVPSKDLEIKKKIPKTVEPSSLRCLPGTVQRALQCVCGHTNQTVTVTLKKSEKEDPLRPRRSLPHLAMDMSNALATS